MITLLILAHYTTPQNVERVWLATAAEVLTVDVAATILALFYLFGV